MSPVQSVTYVSGMDNIVNGGEEGIRTLEKLLTSTPLAGERLRPLGHLSGAPVDREKAAHNQPNRSTIDDEFAGNCPRRPQVKPRLELKAP